ncbi:MAG: pre-peptidase C-terminal domain-containing protein [Gammaproteobacteria bacterium]
MTDDYGNTTTTAGTLAVGAQITGIIEERYDEDWFGVQLQAGTTYWFEALGAKNAAGTADSPRLSLHEPGGIRISGSVSGGANGDAMLAYTPLVSAVHYLAISSGNAGDTYTARVSVAPIQDDHRGDRATTATLDIGGQVTGSLEIPVDSDWFRAELTAGATYQFELRGIDGGGGTAGGGASDLLLRLASDALETTRSSTREGTGGDPLLTFTAIESGTHYVQVSGGYTDSTTGTYTLSAEQIPTLVNFIGGTSGNDVLRATGDDDLIAGSAGLDVVVFDGPSSNYISRIDRYTKIVSVTGSGSDTLHHVERIHYDDIGRAFDIVDGNAGMVAKILGAVFGAASMQNPSNVARGLRLADGGMGYEELAQYALDLALGPDASSVEIVNRLYGNVMQSPPPQEALDFYTGLLDDGEVTPGWLGMYAAESIYNQILTLGIRPVEYPLYFTLE